MGECDMCGGILFGHLTNEAVRDYLALLVNYLDDFDATVEALPEEEWRVVLEMEHSGI